MILTATMEVTVIGLALSFHVDVNLLWYVRKDRLAPLNIKDTRFLYQEWVYLSSSLTFFFYSECYGVLR